MVPSAKLLVVLATRTITTETPLLACTFVNMLVQVVVVTGEFAIRTRERKDTNDRNMGLGALINLNNLPKF